MPCRFIRGRRGNGDHLVSARVQRLCHAPDGAALSGRIPSFEGKDDRDLFQVQLAVKLTELVLPFFQPPAVFVFVQSPVQRNFRQFRHWQKRVDSGADGFPCGRHGGGFLQCFRDLQNHGFENFEFRGSVIHSGKKMPRGGRRVRRADHFVEGLQIFVVPPVPFPVLSSHTPLGVAVFFKLFKALFLLLFADMHEEFDDEIACIRQFALESVDAVKPSRNFFGADVFLQARGGNIHVPAAVQHRKVAGFRDVAPVPPQNRLAPLQFCRLRH